jgi:hypothetical protein
MQHPQATTYPNWLPGAMWQMAKNYRTKYQNGMLPSYNKLSSGKTWHDAFECTKKALWHEYAMKSNTAQENKGLHVPKMRFSNMVLWVLTDYRLCNGLLNIDIHPSRDGGEGKMKSVQALHFFRSEFRAPVKAEIARQTFTDIDFSNKAKIVKNSHRVASKAYEVTSTYGETVKGIAPKTLNACA